MWGGGEGEERRGEGERDGRTRRPACLPRYGGRVGRRVIVHGTCLGSDKGNEGGMVKLAR